MANMAFTEIERAFTAAAMAPAVPDFESLLVGVPRGAWVAISRDETRLLAFSAEMLEVLRVAHANGEADPIIFRVPENTSALAM
jgi:hypothetical protein